MSKVYARNLVTGQITQVPEHYLTHPVFGRNFVAANKHDKDYEPELYKPKTSDEVRVRKPRTEKIEESEVTIPKPTIETPEGGDD